MVSVVPLASVRRAVFVSLDNVPMAGAGGEIVRESNRAFRDIKAARERAVVARERQRRRAMFPDLAGGGAAREIAGPGERVHAADIELTPYDQADVEGGIAGHRRLE